MTERWTRKSSGRLDAAGLKAADPDNDGTLDVNEYAAAVEKKFKQPIPTTMARSTKRSSTPAGQDLLKLIY